MSQPRSMSSTSRSFQSRSSLRHRSFEPRSRVLVVVVVFGLLMTGCQGDASPPGPTAGETSASVREPTTSPSPTPTTSPSEPATPEPTAASSDGPAANIPVPEKPALADENSVEGLEAFTEYWFELFSYGYITNNWDEFLDITDSGCGTCANVLGEVQGHFDDGGWISGGQASLISFASDFETNTEGSLNSFSEVEQSAITYFNEAGDEIGGSAAVVPTIYVTIAIYEDARWVMLDFGSPEGT